MIPYFDPHVSGNAVIFGSISGITSLIIYGSITQFQLDGEFDGNVFLKGLKTIFYDSYDWPQFLVALSIPLVASVLYSLVEMGYYRAIGKKRPILSNLLLESTIYQSMPENEGLNEF